MLEAGQVVYSAAGHDRGSHYVVTGVRDGFCYIADGKRRKLGSPKRKNPRHLCPTDKRVELASVGSDRALRRTLRQLCQALPEE